MYKFSMFAEVVTVYVYYVVVAPTWGALLEGLTQSPQRFNVWEIEWQVGPSKGMAILAVASGSVVPAMLLCGYLAKTQCRLSTFH
jgi:hypothetical protein